MRSRDPAMGSETDIRHAISLRPSPFHTPHGEQSPHRSEIRRSESMPTAATHHQLPASSESITPTVVSQTSVGHSTAWEPLTPPLEGTSDPIARHVSTTLDGVDPEADLEGQRWSVGGRTWNETSDPY